MAQQLEKIYLGGGCFWCTEAVFQSLSGVERVVSGYTGGTIKNPSYREVCMGTTGHAEVIEVSYDPLVIDVRIILEVFWTTHDPTTLNRQGADKGTQYRSAIFCTSTSQFQIADEMKKTFASRIWDNPIVTEIAMIDVFYAAEEYHQNYFNQNGEAAYCQIIINPKLQKFRKQYSALLKPIK
ncbi:MAG: peptide-methionine (S)-S-oxide reductase MsrA [Saprospiraceae bacterium]